MQQIIDMPVPLAIANRQRYFLCAGQTRLNLGLDNIRKIIGERDESETLWLQVMNKNFISPNLLNNRVIKEVCLTPRDSVILGLNSPIIVKRPAVVLLTLVYYPELEEESFNLKNYLQDGLYMHNNMKWSAMASLFTRYSWERSWKVGLIYVDVSFNDLRKTRSQQLGLLLETGFHLVPANEIIDANSLNIQYTITI